MSWNCLADLKREKYHWGLQRSVKVSESKWHSGSSLKSGWCKHEEAKGDTPGAGDELQGRGVGERGWRRESSWCDQKTVRRSGQRCQVINRSRR